MVQTCLRYVIKPTGLPIVNFDKEITITAAALDCSASMTDLSFVPPASIAYNSAGSANLVIAPSYTTILAHT